MYSFCLVIMGRLCFLYILDVNWERRQFQCDLSGRKQWVALSCCFVFQFVYCCFFPNLLNTPQDKNLWIFVELVEAKELFRRQNGVTVIFLCGWTFSERETMRAWISTQAVCSWSYHACSSSHRKITYMCHVSHATSLASHYLCLVLKCNFRHVMCFVRVSRNGTWEERGRTMLSQNVLVIFHAYIICIYHPTQALSSTWRTNFMMNMYV